MEEQNLSQRGLEKRSTVSHNTIGRILCGDVLPDLGTLARLEATLQIDIYPTRLYERLADPPTPPPTNTPS